jgi:hypothetical protein
VAHRLRTVVSLGELTFAFALSLALSALFSQPPKIAFDGDVLTLSEDEDVQIVLLAE